MLTVRIKTLTRAMAEGRDVHLKYHNARGIERERTIEPSHLYESNDGHVLVVAYDDFHDEYRDFRLDRMVSCRIGKKIGEELPDGKVKVYPASYKLRFAKPEAGRRDSIAVAQSLSFRNGPAGMVVGSIIVA